jgi:hypothetical protein
MANMVYVKRCPLCRTMFELPDVADPIPEHDVPGYPGQPCTGAGHPGELVEQKLRYP